MANEYDTTAAEWLESAFTEILGEYPDLSEGGHLPEEAGVDKARDIVDLLNQAYERVEDPETGNVDYVWKGETITTMSAISAASVPEGVVLGFAEVTGLVNSLEPVFVRDQHAQELQVVNLRLRDELDMVRLELADRPVFSFVESSLESLLTQADRYIRLGGLTDAHAGVPGALARIGRGKALKHRIVCLQEEWKAVGGSRGPEILLADALGALICVTGVMKSIRREILVLGIDTCELLGEVWEERGVSLGQSFDLVEARALKLRRLVERGGPAALADLPDNVTLLADYLDHFISSRSGLLRQADRHTKTALKAGGTASRVTLKSLCMRVRTHLLAFDKHCVDMKTILSAAPDEGSKAETPAKDGTSGKKTAKKKTAKKKTSRRKAAKKATRRRKAR